MPFQLKCSIETFWTFIAKIRLHISTSLHVFLKVTFGTEFLLTKVTSEPSSFIVWLQQMSFKMGMPHKLFRTEYTALHPREHEHDASNRRLSPTAFHNKNMNVVLRCCVDIVHVSASGWIGRKICHTMNTCTVFRRCGFSCDRSTVQTVQRTYHTRHLNGFSPLWMLLWLVRCEACVNRFSHTEHSNGKV